MINTITLIENAKIPTVYVVLRRNLDIDYTKNRIINILNDHFGAMPIAAFRKEMELFNPKDILDALDEIESEGKLGYFVTNTKASWIYLKKPEETPKGKFKISIETWDSKGTHKSIYTYVENVTNTFINKIDNLSIEYLLMKAIYHFRNNIFGKMVKPDMRYN